MNSSLNLTNPVNTFNPPRQVHARTLTWISLPGLLLMCVLAMVARPAFAATLTTDQPDYSPGNYITFTGTGFQAGESVSIDISETSVDPIFWVGSVSATASPGGNFSNSDFLIQQSFLGQGFLATATGHSSGLTASTTFTDSSSPITPPVVVVP